MMCDFLINHNYSEIQIFWNSKGNKKWFKKLATLEIGVKITVLTKGREATFSSSY